MGIDDISAYEDNAGGIIIVSEWSDNHYTLHTDWAISYAPGRAADAGRDWARLMGGADPVRDGWDGVATGKDARAISEYADKCEWIACGLWTEDYPAGIDTDCLGKSGAIFCGSACTAYLGTSTDKDDLADAIRTYCGDFADDFDIDAVADELIDDFGSSAAALYAFDHCDAMGIDIYLQRHDVSDKE